MKRLLLVLETLLLLTFWLQTRLDVVKLWPRLGVVPVVSDYLIPFVYVADLLLLLTVLVWAIVDGRSWWASLRSWRPSVSMTGSWWVWLLGLLVVSMLGLLINSVGWWGWYAWLKLVEGAVLMVLVSVRVRDREVAQRYGTVLIGGLMVASVILVGEWIHQGSLGLQWLGEWRFTVHTPGVAKITVAGTEFLRPYATFAHPNVAAGIIALALPWAALSRWPKMLHRWPTWWRWVAVGLLSLGLLLTFSRSAWLVAVGFLAWAAWPSLRAKVEDKAWWNKERRWSVAVILGGVLLLIVLMGPLLVERFVSLSTTDVSSLDRRVQLNDVAVELWRGSPIWGIGLRQFVPEVSTYGPLFGVGIWRQPVHNLYLLIVSEIGLVGLVMILGLLITAVGPLLRDWWTGLNRSTTARLLVGSWISLLLLGMIDHYWWSSQQGWLTWCLLLGATVAYAQKPGIRS